MSVTLQIKYKQPEREYGFIPIAAERTFNNHWLSLSTEFDLKWVSRFNSFLKLTSPEDIPAIIDELSTFAAHLPKATSVNIPVSEADHMAGRVGRLIAALQEVIEKWDEIEYIVFS